MGVAVCQVSVKLSFRLERDAQGSRFPKQQIRQASRGTEKSETSTGFHSGIRDLLYLKLGVG